MLRESDEMLKMVSIQAMQKFQGIETTKTFEFYWDNQQRVLFIMKLSLKHTFLSLQAWFSERLNGLKI